ncbi:hypothetical protein ES705_21068 [subsurface metagenome]
MKKPLSPFTLTYTPNISEILYDLGCSVAVSTYQAGKVILLSAINRDKMIQLPRTFDNPMGIALSDTKMAVACRNDLILLKNFPQLSKNYPSKPETYDAFFIPQCKYYTGTLDLHDMNFVNKKLIAVNTLFSCLSEIDEEYSFTPIWEPEFITDLAPEDRCHLNGIALKDGQIEYVTALGDTDTKQGWRENKTAGGVIIHVPDNKIIAKGLSMPHSPRIYNNKLYFLNSAQGELCICNPEDGSVETIAKLGGFARGMAKYSDFLFIGISKLRHTTAVFKDLPIAKTSFAGIVVFYLPYNKVIGQIRYESSVDEIYDIKILPSFRRPGILNTEKEEINLAIVTPNTTYWAVSEPDKK